MLTSQPLDSSGRDGGEETLGLKREKLKPEGPQCNLINIDAC